jgi:hypothetical protein
MTVFWQIAPSSLTEVDLLVRDAYCLHQPGDISQKTVMFTLIAVKSEITWMKGI